MGEAIAPEVLRRAAARRSRRPRCRRRMRPSVSHATDADAGVSGVAVEDARCRRLLHHPAMGVGRQHVARQRRGRHRVLGNRQERPEPRTPRARPRAGREQPRRRRSRPAAPPSAARRRRTARTTGTSARPSRAARTGRTTSRRRSPAPATANRPARRSPAPRAEHRPARERAIARRLPCVAPLTIPRSRSAPSATTLQPRLTCCSSSPSPRPPRSRCAAPRAPSSGCATGGTR